MSEFLSPGVFIEEVSNAPQTVTAVGTTTAATVGWTLQGPVNQATLITSPNGFTTTFGAYTSQALTPLAVSAFFQNGGTRIYVIRVVPSDAVTAVSSIPDTIVGESLGGLQPGTTPVTVTGTLAHTPATAGTVTINWNKYLTATTESPTMSPPTDGTTLDFTTTFAHHPLTNDVVTLNWQEAGPVSKTATITGASTIGGANAGDISSASLVRTTGGLTIAFAGGHAPLTSSFMVTYNYIGVADSVTDSGGTFTGSGVSGTIDYTSGAISITFTGSTIVPYNGDQVTVNYTGPIWGLSAADPGEWGDSLKFRLAGSPNFLIFGPTTVTGAGTYSKFDITILQTNSSGVDEIMESYEEVVFDDNTDPMYVTDVINQGSSLVTITDYGYLDVPAIYKGVHHIAEVIGTGDSTTKSFTYTIAGGNVPVLKTSPIIKYVIASVDYQAVASSGGTITGTDIDSTKTNTINYTSGAITLNFSTAPDVATSITVDYITMPTTTNDYLFTDGSDGTIANITNLTVSNAIDLQADKLGMYALDRIDEMMNLFIADFAGDITVQEDMMTYADSRRDIFCILSTPSGMDSQDAVDYIQIDMNQKTKYAAVYWPWVTMADPTASTRTLTVPVVSHVAGIYARTDNTRNVAKAPAGTVDGALLGIVDLNLSLDRATAIRFIRLGLIR